MFRLLGFSPAASLRWDEDDDDDDETEGSLREAQETSRQIQRRRLLCSFKGVSLKGLSSVLGFGAGARLFESDGSDAFPFVTVSNASAKMEAVLEIRHQLCGTAHAWRFAPEGQLERLLHDGLLPVCAQQKASAPLGSVKGLKSCVALRGRESELSPRCRRRLLLHAQPESAECEACGVQLCKALTQATSES